MNFIVSRTLSENTILEVYLNVVAFLSKNLEAFLPIHSPCLQSLEVGHLLVSV